MSFWRVPCIRNALYAGWALTGVILFPKAPKMVASKVHYEYMALAKQTSVLREAVEPRRFGASKYADIC